MTRRGLLVAIAALAGVLSLLSGDLGAADASQMADRVHFSRHAYESGCLGWDVPSDGDARRNHESKWMPQIEWLTAAGPLEVWPSLQFVCLLVHGSSTEGVWCAPGLEVLMTWKVRGGEPPISLTIAGVPTNVDAKSASIPCEAIRAQHAADPLTEHRTVAVAGRAQDAAGTRVSMSTAQIATGARVHLVSAAPAERLQGVEIVSGVSDVFLDAGGLTIGPPNYTGGRIISIPVGRYREVGKGGWTYFTPLPGAPQNSCGYWCLASHVRGLQPNTAYEAQAAWMWVGGRHHSPWRRRPATWWQAWTTADALHWSEPQRFRTFGEERLWAESSHDTVTVRWQATNPSEGRVFAWATSPDWPGVAWFDADNSYEPRRREEARERGTMSAVFSGLPADSRFDVTIQRMLPDDFQPAPPDRIAISTSRAPPDAASGFNDPSDIGVELSTHSMTVGWINQRYSSTELHLQLQGGIQGAGIDLPPPSVRDLPGGRTRMTVTMPRPKEARWNLYLFRETKTPSNHRNTYLCMIWSIQISTADPEAFLDRYLHSAQMHQATTIAPGRLPAQPQTSYTYMPLCRLQHYLTGP